MKIVLATGIYPPEIGGPATYVEKLAHRLNARGVDVSVLAYGEQDPQTVPFPVTRVSRKGGMVVRWLRYSKMLRRASDEADIVYAFSSVSAGVPLWLSKLKHPRKVLRLGGDFLWERYTDGGGLLSLRDWYDTKPKYQGMMNGLLKSFDHIVFSTEFQEHLYEKVYSGLPLHHVIENALPSGSPVLHAKHDPLKLLYLGRFVGFKNLGSLFLAMKELPGATLTMVGEGPLEKQLRDLSVSEGIADRIIFRPSQDGHAKQQTFLSHDLLVLPSFTEISPNTALEARSNGLPVLLTEETGLSNKMSDAMQLRSLRSPRDIVNAIHEMENLYPVIAERTASTLPERSWDHVADEHLSFFQSLL